MTTQTGRLGYLGHRHRRRRKKRTIGAVQGNVTLIAGNQYRQVGSDIVAPNGDVTIAGKTVTIEEARETSASATEQKFKQSGLTIGISNPVISAVQTGQQLAQAASNTGDGRMKALAAASTGLAAYNTANSLTDKAGDFDPAKAAEISLNLSLGSSKSQSNSASQSETSKSSTVSAGGNLTIIASGAGQDSDLTVQGSTLTAGNNALLIADNQIKLQAAQNTASNTSTNSSRSGAIGASLGSSGGLTFNASASKSKGSSNGQDTSFTNTDISAGDTATIKSEIGGQVSILFCN